MSSRTIRLAVVGGDGIGPEVTAEALKVLRAATPGVSIDETSYDLGARRWHRTGETLPDAVLEDIRGHDAILLGAVGDPSVPSGVLERGLLLRLRFELDHYVNLRPVRLYPGVATPLAAARPETLDMVVVREGTEGPYTGAGGVMRKGTPAEIATQYQHIGYDGCSSHYRAQDLYSGRFFTRRPDAGRTYESSDHATIYRD